VRNPSMRAVAFAVGLACGACRTQEPAVVPETVAPAAAPPFAPVHRCDTVLMGADCGPIVACRGPWRGADGGWYWAAVAWREGASESCLALLRGDEGGARSVEARGRLHAGYSARYAESYAPSLDEQPLVLPGAPPLPVTRTTSMGAAGGGGDEVAIWMTRAAPKADARELVPVFSEVLDLAIDINDVTENEGKCASALRLQGTRLAVTACFSGAAEERVYDLVGGRFVRAR
jgi:hypothetical protein